MKLLNKIKKFFGIKDRAEVESSMKEYLKKNRQNENDNEMGEFEGLDVPDVYHIFDTALYNLLIEKEIFTKEEFEEMKMICTAFLDQKYTETGEPNENEKH